VTPEAFASCLLEPIKKDHFLSAQARQRALPELTQFAEGRPSIVEQNGSPVENRTPVLLVCTRPHAANLGGLMGRPVRRTGLDKRVLLCRQTPSAEPLGSAPCITKAFSTPGLMTPGFSVAREFV
jgi:hypothetical protein